MPTPTTMSSRGTPARGVAAEPGASATADRENNLERLLRNHQDGINPEVQPVTLRRELCRFWRVGAWCPDGDQCRFPHGESNASSWGRSAKYKTELCKWWKIGRTCSEGDQCR